MEFSWVQWILFSKSLLKYTFLSSFPEENFLKIWKFAITSCSIDLAHVTYISMGLHLCLIQLVSELSVTLSPPVTGMFCYGSVCLFFFFFFRIKNCGTLIYYLSMFQYPFSSTSITRSQHNSHNQITNILTRANSRQYIEDTTGVCLHACALLWKGST